MFFDSSEHPLDAKSRVFLPKRFQSALGRDESGHLEVMLTPGEDGCLFLFSVDGFIDSLGDVDTRAFTTAEERDRQRRLAHASTRVTLDASGRLLITEKLRNLIDLRENADGRVMVKMVGSINRAEIWPLHRWEELETRWEESAEERYEIVGPGGRPDDGRGDAATGGAGAEEGEPVRDGERSGARERGPGGRAPGR